MREREREGRVGFSELLLANQVGLLMTLTYMMHKLLQIDMSIWAISDVSPKVPLPWTLSLSLVIY